MKKLLLALALILFPAAASAQCNGVFPNNTACGNVSGAGNLPRPVPLTSFPSAVPGGTSGQIQYNNSGAFGGFGPITGDLTLSVPGGVGTLATVNSNIGSFGSATQCTIFTVNAKGLITAASQTTCNTAVNYTAPWSGAVAYPQAKLNANVVYMSDFMGTTTCDGTTDQATNINNFLAAVAANGAAGAGSVTGYFAPGNCYMASNFATLTINSSTLPVNYHLIGYGTTLTPNPANAWDAFRILRGTFTTLGDEQRSVTIEGLTVNLHNNANANWGFEVAEGRVSLINNNCYAGDDGTVHNQGNFACIYYHQITSTDPNTGPFYGRISGNTLKGNGTGVSTMPIGIRFDGSVNAMVVDKNIITQGTYGMRIFSPCTTTNANCAYMANNVVIQNNDFENMTDCIEFHTLVPSISALVGGLISGNTMESCTTSVDIATITQASSAQSELAVGPNTVIGGTTYISNPNTITIKTF